MKTRIFYVVFLSFISGPSLLALDGIYLGGQVGHVGLTGDAQGYGNALGFGATVGLRTNPFLDVTLRFDYSSHSGNGGLTLLSPNFSADFHIYEMNDFDLVLGAGPGFYFFRSGGTTESDFGINAGISGDVVLGEVLRLGLGWRWHGIIDSQRGDSFWSIMMRVGCLFSL